MGATWVGRGFSGDVKGTTELMRKAITHHGFAFLNLISPCVTWRGDDQSQELRGRMQVVPEDHDRTDRQAALRFTNETPHFSVGVLYENVQTTLLDEMLDIRVKAAGSAPPPSRQEILQSFAPAV